MKSFLKAVAAIVVGVAVGVVTGGLGAPIAVAIGAGAFTATTSGALMNDVSPGRAVALGAVAGVTAGFGAGFALGAGVLQGAAIGAGFGAVNGAASAAILGGDIGRGALAGAIGGGILGGAVGFPTTGLTGLGQTVLGMGASATAGAAGYAVLGQDPLEGGAVGVTGALVALGAARVMANSHQPGSRTPSLRTRVRDATGYRPPPGGGGPTDVIQTPRGPIYFGHGGRHLSERLTVNQVHNAIAKDVQTLGFPEAGQLLIRKVNVEGISIKYKIYGVSESAFNVGTYYQERQ